MNLASWIILGIVIVAIGFAIRATFFKKNRASSCCDTGDAPLKERPLGCSPSACSTCPCHACSEMAVRYKLVANADDVVNE